MKDTIYQAIWENGNITITYEKVNKVVTTILKRGDKNGYGKT